MCLNVCIFILYTKKGAQNMFEWLRFFQAAVGSKAVVLLLLIYCSMYFPLFVGVLCLSLFCYALLCVHSSFAIILKRERKLVVFLVLSYRCIVTINDLWLAVPWVGLQCVSVVFHDHTHLLLECLRLYCKYSNLISFDGSNISFLL